MSSHIQKVQNQAVDEVMSISGSSVPSNSQQSQRSPHINREQNGIQIQQAQYDPNDYEGLNVSRQVRELFKGIQRYNPESINIDIKMKGFVPDYIPAVGEVDAFLKMPRPDGQPEVLGLHDLDEPKLNGTLYLPKIIRPVSNNKKVHRLDNPTPKNIDQWIKHIEQGQKSDVPPSVHYKNKMPEVQQLMKVWPQEVEEILSQISLPSENIDLSLEDFTKMACNIVDIPVFKEGDNGVIEGLHVLSSLYSAFKENEHFRREVQ